MNAVDATTSPGTAIGVPSDWHGNRSEGARHGRTPRWRRPDGQTRRTNMFSKLALTALTTATLLAGNATADEWTIDPSHASAQFSIKHMMVSSVRGNFQKLSGNVNLDEKDLTKSSVDVTLDATSIDTREPKRDAHLKSPDFFDVAKYPTLNFKSTKIEKGASGGYLVTGDFTMHGVTHPVTLTVDSLSSPSKN